MTWEELIINGKKAKVEEMIKCYTKLMRHVDNDEDFKFFEVFGAEIDRQRDILFELTGDDNYNNEPEVRQRIIQEQLRKEAEEELEDEKEFEFFDWS